MFAAVCVQSKRKNKNKKKNTEGDEEYENGRTDLPNKTPKLPILLPLPPKTSRLRNSPTPDLPKCVKRIKSVERRWSPEGRVECSIVPWGISGFLISDANLFDVDVLTQNVPGMVEMGDRKLNEEK